MLTRDSVTSSELAKFLRTSPRNARKYLRILVDRGLVRREKNNIYVLERLDLNAGRLISSIIMKVSSIDYHEWVLKNIREPLIELHDLLYEALDYCTTELGSVKNPEAYYRIDKALRILDNVLSNLR